MTLSAPSWDLFLTVFLLISLGYGFLMQRERIVITMIAAYVGLGLTQFFWPSLFGFFHGDNPILGKYFLHANITESNLQIGLFIIILLLVSTKAGLDGRRGQGFLSPFELVMLSGLTGALIATTVIFYLPADFRQTVAEQSRTIHFLVKYHQFLTLAPLVTLIALDFRSSSRGY